MSRVLVLDDGSFGSLIELILTRETTDKIVMEPDAYAALARCESDSPDLVIMAWTSVGVMWGNEFTRRLRALPGGKAIPLILVSAYWNPGYVEEIYAYGGDTVMLAVPFEPSDLLGARGRLLGEAAD